VAQDKGFNHGLRELGINPLNPFDRVGSWDCICTLLDPEKWREITLLLSSLLA
jgi:hypothetical protein